MKEKILNFLKSNPIINIRGLERKCGLPNDTIRNALEGKQGLPEKHCPKIEDALKKYSYIKE